MNKIDILLETKTDIKIQVNGYLLQLLREHGVFTKRQHSELSRYSPRWKIGEVIRARKDCQLEKYISIAAGGALFTCGSFSSIASALPPAAIVGRYVSIAPDVRMMGFRHPIEAVSTSSISYQDDREMFRAYLEDRAKAGNPEFNFKKVPTPQGVKKPLTIEHDVWIGSGVTIKNGITIGHGSVIASNSVVTKDVPRYSIVGGNPAKVIRKRFDDHVISLLDASEWWRYDPGTLHQFDMADPERLSKALIEREGSLDTFSPGKLNVWDCSI